MALSAFPGNKKPGAMPGFLQEEETTKGKRNHNPLLGASLAAAGEVKVLLALGQASYHKFNPSGTFLLGVDLVDPRRSSQTSLERKKKIPIVSSYTCWEDRFNHSSNLEVTITHLVQPGQSKTGGTVRAVVTVQWLAEP